LFVSARTPTVQGWSSVVPRFSIADFFSFYIELPVMALMYTLWLLVRRMRHPPASLSTSPLISLQMTRPAQPFFDLVDVTCVDLYHDEHEDGQVDKHEDEERAQRMRGRARWAWAVYYLVA
jgi:AAT family amino acid transporter